MDYDHYLKKEWQISQRTDEILKDLGFREVKMFDNVGGCPDFQKTLNTTHNFNKYLKELRERYLC